MSPRVKGAVTVRYSWVGSPNVFFLGSVGGDGISTKLNFTDTESFASVHSINMGQKLGQGESLREKQSNHTTNRFSGISELERKVH